MRTDALALIRGATEFVTVIYGPEVTFAFPHVKGEAYRRSVLHLNLISAVDGSALNWCEQHALREMIVRYQSRRRTSKILMTTSVTGWEKWIEGTSRYSQSSGI